MIPESQTRERLGRYVLLEPLGEGGMARVFLAKKDGETHVCVLKRLHVQLEAHPIALKRFHREAHIAATLDHPSIAKVVDSGMEEERFFLAVEYIAGETLEGIVGAAVARWGEVPLPIVLAIAADVLEALEYAHAMTDTDGRPLHIVHRDLTPRNVMVGYDGRVTIIDFGIARGDVDEFKTAPGVLMGTPYYMSPEQARTLPVDSRSDLYTFGTVLFELLTGTRLVQAKSRAQILVQVAMNPAPPPSTVNARVPPAIDAVLAHALEKEPDARFQTAGEMREAFLAAAGKHGRASREQLAAAMRELFPDGEAEAARRRSLAEVIETFVGERSAIPNAVSAPPTIQPSEGPFAPTAIRRTPMPEAPELTQRSAPGLDVPSHTTAHDTALRPMTGGGAASTPGFDGTAAPIAASAVMAPVFPITSGFSESGLSAARMRDADARRAKLLGAAALAALLVLAGALWMSFGRRTQPAVSAPAEAPRVAVRARETPVARAIAVPGDTAPVEDTSVPEAPARARARQTTRAAPAKNAPARADEDTEPKETATDEQPAAREAARFRDLRDLLAKLTAAPADAELRTRLHDRIEAAAEKLPARRKARVTAAIDEAIRSVEVGGFERALKQLEQAAESGEL